MRRLALVALAALVLCAAPAKAAPWIGVDGNRLVDGGGHTVRLLGVNRSGTEYSCRQGYGSFDGPSDAASILVMKRWQINTVRVPLNETCWLGINGIAPELGGEAYQRAIGAWVSRLEQAGLYIVLDLHVAAPGARQATGIIPMPDADHAPAQVPRRPGLHHVVVDRRDWPVDHAGHRAQRQDHRQRRQECDGDRRRAKGEGRNEHGCPAPRAV